MHCLRRVCCASRLCSWSLLCCCCPCNCICTCKAPCKNSFSISACIDAPYKFEPYSAGRCFVAISMLQQHCCFKAPLTLTLSVTYISGTHAPQHATVPCIHPYTTSDSGCGAKMTHASNHTPSQNVMSHALWSPYGLPADHAKLLS